MICDDDTRRPPRHKMAVLTFVGLLAPVYFVPPVFQAVLPDQRLITVMLSVASIVLLMTYAIMPALTRVGSAWLQSDGRSVADSLRERTGHRARSES